MKMHSHYTENTGSNPVSRAAARAHRGVVKKLFTAGLAVTMAFAMSPAVIAFAADTDNTITITNVQGNTTTFDGYLIFTANVTDDSSSTTGKSEQNIAWASTQMQTAVESAIKSIDSSYSGTTAQDAANWLQAHITTSTAANVAAGELGNSNVASGGVADTIAHKIKESGIAPTVTLTSGTASSALAQGYYLFTTTDSTLDATSESATSPILAVVGGSSVTVTEKAKTVTSLKEIQSDADGSWGQYADSQIGQVVNYKITGNVSGNIDTFDTYSYAFHDNLSQGLDATVNASGTPVVTVKLYENAEAAAADSDGTAGTDVTSNFTSALAAAGANDAAGSHNLTVSCADIKAMKDANGNVVTVSKDSVLVVYYSAALNSNAVIAGTGNPNTAYVEYSNNPYSNGTGTTQPNTPKDYTYQLKMIKVDRNTEVTLQGAQFTIQATSPDDQASNGKYVQQDGTLGDTAYTFETDANGVISVKGLDTGTYTVTETKAPDGYSTIPSFTFTITPAYGTDGTLDSVTNQVSGSDAIAGTPDGTPGDNTLTAAANTAYDATTGTINVTIGDGAQVGLPLTGQSGLVLTVVIGGSVVAISAYALTKRSRREQE